MRNYLNSKLKIFRLQTANQIAIVNYKFKSIFKEKVLSQLNLPKIKEYKELSIK